MLADLERRDLRTDRSILFVIDGSKALYSAIRAVFGERALVQRCQVHVLRWIATSLSAAAKGCRKLRGYKGMPKLVAALRTHDAALGITLEVDEKAA